MVRHKRWGYVVALVSLSLTMLCGTARAQVFSTPPTNVSNNSHYSFTPQVAVDSSGNIYVVWEDDTANNNNILFSRSTDKGATFSTPIPINIPNSSGYGYNPRIAVDSGGGINVVWQDNPPPNHYDVFFSRSTDGGATFSAPTNLSKGATDYGSPQIAADTGGSLYVVWEGDGLVHGIFFSRSTDGGKTFTYPPTMLSNNPNGSLTPQIALGSTGDINVVWQDDSGGHAYTSFSRSTDAGVTFSTPVPLSNTSGGSIAPELAVDLSGNINVVWQDNSLGNFDIFFSRSTDKGATFSIPKNLSNSLGTSGSPRIAVAGSGNINVVWQHNTPTNLNPDIFFTRSSDGGATFSPLQNLSNDAASAFSSNAWMTVDASGNINVAWEGTTATYHDIFFARSVDQGATFSTPPQNLSNGPGLSSDAQIAVDKLGNINVVWANLAPAPGVSQIFFSRGTPSQPPALPSITSQPASQTVTLGQMATFSVTASGTGTLTYQWQKNRMPISGANAASYTTPPTLASDSGSTFDVVVSNSAGSTTSNTATLTVNVPPSITSQPASQTVTAGQVATFSVTASGTAPLSYQWQKNGANIANAISASYTTPPTLASDSGSTFRVVVRNAAGTATSNAATLTVDPPNLPPVANAGPDQTVQCGTRATLDGSKSSDPDGDVLSFVWKDQANNMVVGTTAVVSVTLSSLGTHTFTLTVTDPGGLSSTASTHVTVGDTIPPTLLVLLSPPTLWPPNHRLVQINATVTASDACGLNPAVKLVSITSNEPDISLDPGDQPDDIQAMGGGPIAFGTDIRSFMLRAERLGSGTGRIYTVTYSATGPTGLVTLATGQVYVPHDTSGTWLKRLRRGSLESRESRAKSRAD